MCMQLCPFAEEQPELVIGKGHDDLELLQSHKCKKRWSDHSHRRVSGAPGHFVWYLTATSHSSSSWLGFSHFQHGYSGAVHETTSRSGTAAHVLVDFRACWLRYLQWKNQDLNLCVLELLILFLLTSPGVIGVYHHALPLFFGVETGSHSAAQTGLEHISQSRLALETQWSSCLSFRSTGITDLNHHILLSHSSPFCGVNVWTYGFEHVKQVLCYCFPTLSYFLEIWLTEGFLGIGVRAQSIL